MIARLEAHEAADQARWEERTRLKERIDDLKRERLKESKLLSNMSWSLEVFRRNISDTIIINADEESVVRYMRELEFYLGSFGSIFALYKFSNGDYMRYHFDRDDATLNIEIDFRFGTIADYMEAFVELGITISLDGIDACINDLRERANQLENMIREFR